MPSGDQTPAGSTQPPGLQSERTRLAWRRTVLTATACLLLLLRQALNEGTPRPIDVAALIVGLASWIVFALAAQRRIHAMRLERPAGTARLISLTGAAAIGLTLSAVLLNAT